MELVGEGGGMVRERTQKHTQTHRCQSGLQASLHVHRRPTASCSTRRWMM